MIMKSFLPHKQAGLIKELQLQVIAKMQLGMIICVDSNQSDLLSLTLTLIADYIKQFISYMQ